MVSYVRKEMEYALTVGSLSAQKENGDDARGWRARRKSVDILIYQDFPYFSFPLVFFFSGKIQERSAIKLLYSSPIGYCGPIGYCSSVGYCSPTGYCCSPMGYCGPIGYC